MDTNGDIDPMDRPFSRRLLSTFNIEDNLLWKLMSKGFTLKSEILVLSDSKLQAICDLTEEELDSINDNIRNSHKIPLIHKTLSEMNSSPNARIHTSSQSMDYILFGGIEVSKITQICGEGGVGKTQMCMQLCINVETPESIDGLSGEALYIDTEDNLRPERLQSMAKFCLEEHPELKKSLSVETMISRIHLFSCKTKSKDLVDLIDHKIEPFIDENRRIKLIVIDSIAQLFRCDYKGNDEERDYELSRIGLKLKMIAHQKKVAIVITNQVAYSPTEDKDIPALGKLWQTYCSTNIMISRTTDELRMGSLLKSTDIPIRPNFYFKITENGIKDGFHGFKYH